MNVMTDIYELRKIRMEKIKKEGPIKFIAKYGISFSLLFGSFVLFVARPPISIYILILFVLVGGFFFGIFMWIFMLFQFKKYR